MAAPILVSSYALSPAHTVWDPALEEELLEGLCALPGVVGLEVPWIGAVHPHDTAWFERHVPEGARLAVTALPWVMGRCAASPAYGLASSDPDGRAAAVADLRALADDIRRLNDGGRARVDLVPLHTAPRGGGDAGAASDADALAASLAELHDIDWDGASLAIEHCDALIEGQPYEKGFLSLAAELDALAAHGGGVGMILNWGRSVIEVREPDTVAAHVAQAAAAGLLRGLTFSGSAAADGPYGAAWEDRHLPLASADPDALSLLTDARVTDALVAAGDVDWLGLKVSRRPADRTAADVIRTARDNLRVLDHVRAAAPV